MKTHTIVKGNVTVYFRIGAEDAEMKKQVGENKPTSVESMTPLQATQRLNQLLRQGYANKTAQKSVDPTTQKR